MTDLLPQDSFPKKISDDLYVEECGGSCPTQAKGTICGFPFYFRARSGEWVLIVVKAGEDPTKGYFHPELRVYCDVGEDETYGYVRPGDVIRLLERTAVALTKRLKKAKQS